MWEELIHLIQMEDEARRKSWWRRLFGKSNRYPLSQPINPKRWT